MRKVLVWCGFYSLFIALCGANLGNVDCNVLLPQDIHLDCCPPHSYNMNAYAKECGRFNILHSSMDSCGNDCVLNVTRIIKGNSLDLKNLQKMVKAIIPLDEVYAEILIDAYKLCGMSLPNMRLMTNDANSFSGEPKQDANQNVVTRNGIENEKDDEEDVEPVGCSTLSMMLNSCAIQMTLLTCPPERWNATASCEFARRYRWKCASRTF